MLNEIVKQSPLYYIKKNTVIFSEKDSRWFIVTKYKVIYQQNSETIEWKNLAQHFISYGNNNVCYEHVLQKVKKKNYFKNGNFCLITCLVLTKLRTAKNIGKSQEYLVKVLFGILFSNSSNRKQCSFESNSFSTNKTLK